MEKYIRNVWEVKWHFNWALCSSVCYLWRLAFMLWSCRESPGDMVGLQEIFEW